MSIMPMCTIRFRQMTPDTGMDSANGDQNIDNTVVASAVAATIDEIYERTGQDSILVTHSQGGAPGWETALYTDHIAAMWAYMASTADTFTEAYKAAGGNSTAVRLPDEGITRNSHFMFQELNNDVIAEHVETWIQENVI